MGGPYAPGSAQQPEIICPRCERPNAPGTSFCGRCGQSLVGVQVRMPGGGPLQGQQAQGYYPPQQVGGDARPYYLPDQPAMQGAQGDYRTSPPPVQRQYPASYGIPQQWAANQPAKNVGLSLLLTIVFGPLGLFYATVVGGVIMVVVGAIAITLFFALVNGRLEVYVPLTVGGAPTWVTYLAIGIWVGLVVASSIWGAVAISSRKGKAPATVAR